MSLLPQQTTVNQYIADGVTTVYNYVYYIPLATDISVYITPPNTPPNPIADLQVLNTNYTVQNAGNINGGTVTFLIAPVSGAVVTLVQSIQASYNIDFSQARNISGANLNLAFERVTAICASLLSTFNRTAIQYAIDQLLPTSPANGNIVPQLGNNQVWAGLNGRIIATTIDTSSSSLLRGQLASQAMGADGASLVGYYNTTTNSGTTVDAALNALNTSTKNIGHQVASTVEAIAAIPILTATNTNLTFIDLTVGSWDIWGNIYYIVAGGINVAKAWMNNASATLVDKALTNIISSGSNNLGDTGVIAPGYSVDVLSGTTRIYLIGEVNITSSTVTMCGGLFARLRNN